MRFSVLLLLACSWRYAKMSLMYGATNKITATPTGPTELLVQTHQQKTGNRRQKGSSFVLIWNAWAAGMSCWCFSLFSKLLYWALLGIYCALTYTCAIKEQHPHYHCENGMTWPGYKAAVIVELVFVILEVSSRAIFLAFCFKSIRKRSWIQRGICRTIFDICKRLVKLPIT